MSQGVRTAEQPESLAAAHRKALALVAGHVTGEQEARELVERFHPRWAAGEESSPDRGAARQALARSLGWTRWSELVRQLELRERDEAGRALGLIEALTSDELEQAEALLAFDPCAANRTLAAAAASGELAAVEALLAAGTAADAPSGRGRTPLLELCFSRWLRDEQRAPAMRTAARALLDAGADPNASYAGGGDEGPQTCLYGAAGVNNDPDLTELLLQRGADPNDGTGPEVVGAESLYHAAEWDDAAALEVLLAAKPHQSKIDYCLGRAIDTGAFLPVRAFLEAGADPNARVGGGDGKEAVSLLHRAAALAPPGILADMLEFGGQPTARNARGHTLTRVAVRYGREDVKALLRTPGRQVTDMIPRIDWLMGSINSGDLDSAVFLVRSNAALAAQLETEGPDILAAAAAKGELESVKGFFSAGLSPADPRVGASVFHACWFGHREVVAAFIEGGLDLELVSGWGGTPLNTAVYASLLCTHPSAGQTMRSWREADHGDHAGVVADLLEAGAKPPPRLAGRPDVVEVLLRHGVAEPET